MNQKNYKNYKKLKKYSYTHTGIFGVVKFLIMFYGKYIIFYEKWHGEKWISGLKSYCTLSWINNLTLYRNLNTREFKIYLI